MVMAKRLTFRKMLGLVLDNNAYRQFFSDELLLAIFWEETLFENRAQIGGATGKIGLGFGQVQQSTLPLVNQFFSKELKIPMSWRDGDIIGSEDKAVEVACRTLYMLRTKNRATGKADAAAPLQLVLRRYGGVGEADAGLGTAKQMAIINGWLQCETMLKQMKGDFQDGNKIRDALRKARVANDHAFLPSFPLLGKKLYYSWGAGRYEMQRAEKFTGELGLLGASPADDISIHTSCVVALDQSVKLPGDPIETDIEKAALMRVPVVAASDLGALMGLQMPVTGAQSSDLGRKFLRELPPLN